MRGLQGAVGRALRSGGCARLPPAEPNNHIRAIMFLIAGGTGFGALTAVLAGAARLTDARHRLRLDRLSPKRKG